MVCHRFRVVGLVQNVGFRWSCQAEARRLGVVGWVTNEDEAVTGFVQGDGARVEAFVQWLHHGPPRAVVKEVVLSPGTPVPTLASFLIRP